MNEQLVAPAPMTLMLLQEAVSKGVGVDVLERLMGLHERWEKNEARRQFDAALADAKAELPIIGKNRQVGFDSKKQGASRTSYKHADLAEIVREVTPVLSKHGLSHRFRTTSEPNEPITVTCIIAHRAGYSEENTLRAGRDESGNKNAIQAIGSTVTYLSRYTLMAALGAAASADDDATSSEPIELITDQEAVELQLKLDAAKLSAKRFCEKFKIDKITDLPGAELEHAYDAINTYVMQRKAAS